MNGMASFKWTDEACADLGKYWALGWSASEIAKVLGKLSRNAVIGKVHRLGLAGGERAKGEQPMRRRDYTPRTPKPKRTAPLKVARLTNHGNRFDHVEVNEPDDLPDENLDDALIPFVQRKQLPELEPHHCRWPVGEPNTPEFFFCGDPTANMLVEQPYCAVHAKRSRGKSRPFTGERHASYARHIGKRA